MNRSLCFAFSCLLALVALMTNLVEAQERNMDKEAKWQEGSEPATVATQAASASKSGGWGTIETAGTGTDTIALVKVGGDRQQMGYWYGRLLAEQISGAWNRFYAAFGVPDEQYDAAVAAMWKSEYFDTAAWQSELEGVAAGCADAGHPEITYSVMQKMLMIPDMSEYNCGLYALWGQATVNGDLFQLRNLDWTMDAGVQDYPVVVMYYPSDGHAHATIGFAGMLGAAGGGMNEFGLAVSEIMGHFCDPETLDGCPFPVLLREVLYHDSTLAAGLSRMQNAIRTNQYHYALADPAAPDPKGRLIFSSNTRFDMYGDESVVGHPCESPDPFHTRIEDALYWKRHDGGGNENLYNAIMARYGSINAAKAIEIARADGVSGTLLSIVYHNTAREFHVAFANGLEPAHLQQYVRFRLGENPGGVGGAGYRTSAGSGTEEVAVVTVSGTPFEMGHQYGRLLKAEISEFVPRFLAYVTQGFSEAELDAAWDATAPHTDDRYEQELMGIAAGAEIDYVALRRIHCAAILDTYSCSSVAAWGTATADQHLYQTRDLDWDMDARAHDFPAVVIYFPSEGHPHANLCFAGLAGSHTGMNYQGVALAEMGDSPGSERPFNIDGVHFMPLFRTLMYDADNLTEALGILQNAPRIKRYHYVFGDGKHDNGAVKIKAHAPEAPPNDLIVWHDNDPTDEFAPNVLDDVVYNDEGRGAFPTLQAQYGQLDADKMMALAKQIATHGGNVVDVVYDTTDLELWVAFAEGDVEAYQQPYVHIALTGLDGDGDQIPDVQEGTADPDADGLPSYVDTDSDGDTIEDAAEGVQDADSDTVPNYLDTDSDGDSISDEVEAAVDSDSDGAPDYLDTDSDDDGLVDSEEGVGDPDGDSIANYVDPDSDNDGMSDKDEKKYGSDPYDANSKAPLPLKVSWLLGPMAAAFTWAVVRCIAPASSNGSPVCPFLF